MTVTEKVAYLRGILDASELSEDAKETRIFKAIADVLDDLAMTVSDLEDGFSELSEQIDAVDEDLDALEQDYYDDEDYEDEDDDEFVEVKCPNCGDTICLDEETLLAGEVDCPNCGETLEFDLQYADECGCGCEDDSCSCEECGHDVEVEDK